MRVCVAFSCLALQCLLVYIYIYVREWQIQQSSDLMRYASQALGTNDV